MSLNREISGKNYNRSIIHTDQDNDLEDLLGDQIHVKEIKGGRLHIHSNQEMVETMSVENLNNA
jgi:hypothetical protein